MLFWIIAGIIDIIALWMLVFSKNSLKEMAQWACAIILLPFLGALIFVLLGYQRYFLTSEHLSYNAVAGGKYHAKLNEQYAEIQASNRTDKELLLYNIESGDAILSAALTYETYTNGEQKFAALAKDIDAAQKYIHIQYYIFENDSIGKYFIDLLCKKAEQGVEVRLFYDPWGNRTDITELFAKLRAAGGEITAYCPVFSKHFLRFNYRNHRKLVIIDGIIGYIGGMNVSKNYANMGKIIPWRDTHIRITGDIVKSLQLRFLMDWAYVNDEKLIADKKYFPKLNEKGTIPMQIIASGPDKKQEPIKNGFIRIIDSAKETLYMESGYFIPDKPLFAAIKNAAQRGVDVRIILSSVSDHYTLYATAATFLKELIASGVKVYYYQGFIHSKSIVADGRIVNIGSANLDIRSFFANFELTSIAYDADLGAKHNEIFFHDLENCHEVTAEDIASRSFKDKITGNFMRLLTPLL